MTRFFDRASVFLLLCVTLPLLFLPKINLFSVAGQTAGLRVDDLVLFSFAVVIFFAHFALFKRVIPIEKTLFSIVFLSFLSFGLNQVFVSFGWLNVDAKIFYCVRLLEYFLFFYIGILAADWISSDRLARVLFWINGIVILLQAFSLVGGFTIDGYISNVSYRAMGLASFPSEMGGLLSILFAFLLFSKRSDPLLIYTTDAGEKLKEKFFTVSFFLLTAGLAVLTGSRIALASIVLTFIAKIKEMMGERAKTTAIFILLLGGVGAFLVGGYAETVIERSEKLLSLSNIELAKETWDRIDIDREPELNERLATGDHDMSWWIRIHKWCYALKIYLENPECYLQGVGPGFALAALDGGFLRILVEYGLVGVFLFYRLFSQMAKRTRSLKWSVIALLVNMIFFDAYLAYKPMSLLFFLTGHAYFEKPESD